MFAKTTNPYRFKYLVTGITGQGIDQVYLPQQPPDDQIAFKQENKFVRPEMPEQLKKWAKEYHFERQENPDYIHAHQDEINEWESREDDRCTYGFWFWNKGEATYITGFYYWMLTCWNPYFGKPMYRETDKEITYWIQFWEEDPDSFGGCLNTVRRYGKSSIMGAWIVYRATRNFNHMAGMQGETDKKISAFYKKFVLRPFHKLPPYMQPTYNLDTKQASKIEFDIPPSRGKKRTRFDTEDLEVLESMIDYRASGEGEYDGEILNSYIMEEPGKTQKVSLYNEEGEGRWDIVKPCFLQGGEEICGKAFLGTTVENLKVVDKGGRAYQLLFYDSDFNNRNEDGRTMSGLYTAFLRARFSLKKYIDEWGFPLSDEAWQSIERTRRSYAKRPSKLAGWIRKYPDTIEEIFYVNPEKCEFNSVHIQERLHEINGSPIPLTDKIDFYWENGTPDTRVLWRHAPENGWCQVARGLGFKDMANNLVQRKGDKFLPMNDKIILGVDPIEHGVVSQPGRASKPVGIVKLVYDPDVDGPYPATIEELESRYESKYPYKTNRKLLMYDHRPTDPNKFFEYMIMICVYFGCRMSVESQKYSIINYFHHRGYGAFVMPKYRPDHSKPDRERIDGTPASKTLTQQMTSLIATQKEYFCHLEPFKEILYDNLVFNPNETKPHDYTMAEGYTELGCESKAVGKPQQLRDIHDYFPGFNRRGMVVK